MYKCIRCEQYFNTDQLPLSCPSAPDRGSHETIDIRPGHSVHELSCPRANPSPLVMDECTCYRIEKADGGQ